MSARNSSRVTGNNDMAMSQIMKRHPGLARGLSNNFKNFEDNIEEGHEEEVLKRIREERHKV